MEMTKTPPWKSDSSQSAAPIACVWTMKTATSSPPLSAPPSGGSSASTGEWHSAKMDGCPPDSLSRHPECKYSPCYTTTGSTTSGIVLPLDVCAIISPHTACQILLLSSLVAASERTTAGLVPNNVINSGIFQTSEQHEISKFGILCGRYACMRVC